MYLAAFYSILYCYLFRHFRNPHHQDYINYLQKQCHNIYLFLVWLWSQFYVNIITTLLECVWNLMAHGDAREGKWRGNWRMEWVASTLTLPRNVVYAVLLTLMRTSRLPAVDWPDVPRRFKWTRPFRRKTKSGFCACAITFKTQSTRTEQDRQCSIT